MHPIYSTAIRRPDLVLDHLSAYAALAVQEAGNSGNELKVRAIGLVLSGVFALLFVLFAGIAAMLAAVHGQFHWALVAVPASALVLMLVALIGSRRSAPSERFGELRRQVATDLEILRAAGQRHGS